MELSSCLLGTPEVFKQWQGGSACLPQLAALRPSLAVRSSPDPTGMGSSAKAKPARLLLGAPLAVGLLSFRVLPPLRIFKLQEGDGAGFGGGGLGQRVPRRRPAPGEESTAGSEV